jgi:predicted O-methyltransferase YrrM
MAEGMPNWFTHADLLLPLIAERKPKQCAEIGSWMGSSAIPIARLIEEWGGQLHCVDHWSGQPYWTDIDNQDVNMRQFLANLARHGVTNVTQWVLSSHEAVEQFPKESLDFIYLDGAHDFSNVISDLILWWDRLTPGGLIAGDDYGNPNFPGVTKAWASFWKYRDCRLVFHQNPACESGNGLVYFVKPLRPRTTNVEAVETGERL